MCFGERKQILETVIISKYITLLFERSYAFDA